MKTLVLYPEIFDFRLNVGKSVVVLVHNLTTLEDERITTAKVYIQHVSVRGPK